jgi:hypothetical protein
MDGRLDRDVRLLLDGLDTATYAHRRVILLNLLAIY